MNKELTKKYLTWLLSIMIVMSVTLFYCNMVGKRILGSNVEKWKPQGNNRSHK